MNKFANLLLNPQRAALKIWKTIGRASFENKLDYDLFERPHYAYCLANAARLARNLKVDRIAALEFGVAGGRGLLVLESLCREIENAYGVEIEIWGFDTGEGLPEPEDYRDLPYIWKEGFYQMNESSLRAKLNRANLVLGNVKDTVPAFFEKQKPAPIAAAFFDLDFWSSTRDSFEIFNGSSDTMLPRVFCYCDDVVSAEGGGVLCEDVGQLRAIRDYNDREAPRRLRRIAGMAEARPVRAVWPYQIYVHHAFDHPDYTRYVHSDKDRQLSL